MLSLFPWAVPQLQPYVTKEKKLINNTFMGQELISPLRGFKNTFELCCVSERETWGKYLAFKHINKWLWLRLKKLLCKLKLILHSMYCSSLTVVVQQGSAIITTWKFPNTSSATFFTIFLTWAGSMDDKMFSAVWSLEWVTLSEWATNNSKEN